MKKIVIAILLLAATSAFAGVDEYYQRVLKEFRLEAAERSDMHMMCAFYFLEKSAISGCTESMFALGLFKYAEPNLNSKEEAIGWWDMYLKSEPDPNPDYLKTIEWYKHDFEWVKMKVKEVIADNALDTDESGERGE